MRRYIAFDASEDALTEAADALTENFPAVDVLPIAGDFERDLHRVPSASGPRLVAFLGSTLGNFASATCARPDCGPSVGSPIATSLRGDPRSPVASADSDDAD